MGFASYEFSLDAQGVPALGLVSRGSSFEHKTAYWPKDSSGDLPAKFETAFKKDLVDGFHTAALDTVFQDIRFLDTVSDPVGVKAECMPATCNTDRTPTSTPAEIAKSGKDKLAFALGGQTNPDTGEVFTQDTARAWLDTIGLADDQFRCIVDPKMTIDRDLPERPSVWGLVQFKPQFHRLVVMPDAVELIYYEDGAAPTRDWQIVSMLKKAHDSDPTKPPMNVGVCGAQPLATSGKHLPAASFTNEAPNAQCNSIGSNGYRTSPCDTANNTCGINAAACASAPYFVDTQNLCPFLEQALPLNATCDPAGADHRRCTYPDVCNPAPEGGSRCCDGRCDWLPIPEGGVCKPANTGIGGIPFGPQCSSPDACAWDKRLKEYRCCPGGMCFGL